MKLSELKPCACCGGKLPPIWWILKGSLCAVDRQAANETLGLAQMFQGNLALAEVMGAQPDNAVVVQGDKQPDAWSTIFLCMDCASGVGEKYSWLELEQRCRERVERLKAGQPAEGGE